MNDPHVIALVYRIEHDDSIDYTKAEPFCCDEQDFRLEVEDEIARFEMHEHFPTIEEAHESLTEYLRAWEFDAQLKHGSETFQLVLDREKSKLIDRKPTPGRISLSGICASHATSSVGIQIQPPAYPKPPSNIKLNPDAETMYAHYMGYLGKHEPLQSMAYFCLSMLEDPSTQQSSRRMTAKREAAAEKFGIDKLVLSEIGHLSTTRGGEDARKREGTSQPLSSEERHFLNRAVKAIIRRVAEKEHTPEGNLPTISLSDLPPLETDSDTKTKK